MDDFFGSYWWLLFPIGFFLFGAWDRWLYYRRSRDHLELIKTYAAQGKEPPPELVRGARDPVMDDAADWGPPMYGRRAWRRYYRWGPYWQWRSAIVTGAVAAGFWFASEYSDIPGTEFPFHLVAIIMSFVAAGNLVAAIFSTMFRER